MTKQNVLPGVHDGVPRSVYESWCDADGRQLMHYSMLKLMAQPPAKAKYQIDFPPEPSDALTMGDGCHAAVFEPERFESEFARTPKINRRTSAGKAEWAAFEAAAMSDGKAVLPADKYDKAVALRDAIWTTDNAVRSILASPGKVERSFVWEDPESGVLCKARADWMCLWRKWTVCLDLKTTDVAAPWRFKYAIRKFHYAKQAAFYLDGLDVLAKTTRRWLWLAVEKEPPYLTALYEPTPAMLAAARREYRCWIDTLKQCLESGVWPGYGDAINAVDDVPFKNGDDA